MVWLNDEAGDWRLFFVRFPQLAGGVLRFYHAAVYLQQSAEAQKDGNSTRVTDGA
ncbi:hypothetical protein S7335_4696 [Synechococcus sp. PCC 7335]|uniref:hypothetical protein n=1 Tax=Synechococcus sp. (strain ATCC 29403 / PCC 7335) TaxID=91464 RepID=UPI00017ED1BD|nr:hypothetical protein S7335_4696 [Synechococcus sp. PCC 7335]